MKSNRLRLAGALFAGAIAVSPVAPASASPVLVGTPGDATGINDLVINFGSGPITYDVTFTNAAFKNTYIFGTDASSLEAAQALTNALNDRGVTGLTGATYDSSSGGLFAMIPYAQAGSALCGFPCFLSTAAQLNGGSWQASDGWTGPTSGALFNADFALFTVAPSPVAAPVAGALPGMITVLGGAGLFGRWRRKRKAVAELAA